MQHQPHTHSSASPVSCAVWVRWSQRNSKCMTDKHICVAWVLQCENRTTECSTIPLNVLFCFNGLCFRVHGESSFLSPKQNTCNCNPPSLFSGFHVYIGCRGSWKIEGEREACKVVIRGE